MHRALGYDLAGPASWEISLSERGLVAQVIPVWGGVRPYDGGRREFRDPAQLRSPGFRRTLERAPLVIGHPRDESGRFVYLGASAPSLGIPLEWAAGQAAAYPFGRYQVGALGDQIEEIEIDGIPLPRVRCTVTDPQAIALVLGRDGIPRREVSLGFVKHVIDEPGEWVSPSGERIAYDAVQIIDPDDPRVPAEIRPWVGANYLGIGFAAGESRGEYTRLGGDSTDRPSGRPAPRTFFLVRQDDESGVSGTGHVLDGLIWPDGQVVTKWCAGGPSELNVSESFEEWRSIHVDKHPANKSLIIFDDGGPIPVSPPASDNLKPPVQSENMNPDELMKMIETLKAENAALKAELEKLRGGAESDQAQIAKAKEELAAAQAAGDSKTAAIAKLEAELAPVRKAQREAAAAEVARVAGIDSKDLEGESPDDLKVSAMKKRIALGLDQADARWAEDRVYLIARFDHLSAAPAHAPSSVSAGFAAAVAADSRTPATKVPLANPINDLP